MVLDASDGFRMLQDIKRLQCCTHWGTSFAKGHGNRRLSKSNHSSGGRTWSVSQLSRNKSCWHSKHLEYAKQFFRDFRMKSFHCFEMWNGIALYLSGTPIPSLPPWSFCSSRDIRMMVWSGDGATKIFEPPKDPAKATWSIHSLHFIWDRSVTLHLTWLETAPRIWYLCIAFWRSTSMSCCAILQNQEMWT